MVRQPGRYCRPVLLFRSRLARDNSYGSDLHQQAWSHQVRLHRRSGGWIAREELLVLVVILLKEARVRQISGHGDHVTKAGPSLLKDHLDGLKATTDLGTDIRVELAGRWIRAGDGSRDEDQVSYPDGPGKGNAGGWQRAWIDDGLLRHSTSLVAIFNRAQISHASRWQKCSSAGDE